MANVNPKTDEGSATGSKAAGEPGLQGGELNGSAQEDPATSAEGESEQDTDSELRLEAASDTETATLYRDGLDLEEDYDTLAGTRGSSATIP